MRVHRRDGGGGSTGVAGPVPHAHPRAVHHPHGRADRDGTYKGAEAALITKDTIAEVFSAQPLRPGEGAKVVNEPDADPWRDTPRVNLLLMGPTPAPVGSARGRTR